MRSRLLTYLLLAIIVLVVYGQTVRYDFVAYDDNKYVTENDEVRAGLTTGGLLWAFTARYEATWQPLTWLSLMLDSQLFGASSGGFHLTNVVLHLLNTLLLLALLQRMTRRFWPSAVVAALFAFHPLHVEAVAWVSARKDVLSTFFALLSLHAYVGYVRKGGSARYAVTAMWFALGLMAKPMLVTLPLLMLLLDFWPLRRGTGAGWQADWGKIGRLTTEKLPLLALSVLSSVVTFLAQRGEGAVISFEHVRIGERVANALVSSVGYLTKTIWPVDLTVMYVHPSLPGGTPLAGWEVTGAALVLIGITAAVVISCRSYAVVGWLWYVGTLVPVSGLVQFGSHAMADRFSYVPLVGVFILTAWSGSEVVNRLAKLWPRSYPIAAGMTIIIVSALAACSWHQVRYWRDSASLFRHALEVEPRNPVMHYNLAVVLQWRSDPEVQIYHYRRALEVMPDYADANNNLGVVLSALGRQGEAIVHFERTLAAKPDHALAHLNLARALSLRGETEQAAQHLRRAIQLDPRLTQVVQPE